MKQPVIGFVMLLLSSLAHLTLVLIAVKVLGMGYTAVCICTTISFFLRYLIGHMLISC